MKELQKARSKSIGWVRLVLWVAIVGFSVLFWVTDGFVSVKSWDELDFDSDLNRTYVKNVIPDLYGEFFERHSDDSDKVIKTYYYLGTGTGKYMCISFREEEIGQAEALMNAYKQYENGEITEEELKKYSFTTQGVIRKLKEDDTEYIHMQTYVNWRNLSEEERSQFLFYELQAESISYRDGEWIAIGCLVGFFIILLLIIEIIVRGPFGRKSLKKYIKESDNPQLAKERIKSFFDNDQVAPDLWLNNEFIGGLRDEKIIFGELKKLVWMYETDELEKHTNSHAAYYINLHFVDGSKQQLMYNESLEQLFDWMEENCPWVMLGYSDKLKELYNRNLSGFLSIQYYPKKEI